jgi:alkaline phosphatase D
MADGLGKTMLGQAQRDWLLDGLRASDATWKLVVTSVSLSVATGRDARDGWANGSFHLFRRGTPTGFEHELGEIVRQLAAARVRNVVWLGADIHHAEVIRHAPWPGLAFHELLAGPLQAGTSQAGFLDDTLGPTRLYAEGGFYNFGELRIQPAGLEVRIIDADGRERFATTLVPEP